MAPRWSDRDERRFEELVEQCSRTPTGRRKRGKALVRCKRDATRTVNEGLRGLRGVNDASRLTRTPRRTQSYTTLARQDARKSARGRDVCPSSITIEVRERMLGNVTAEAFDASGRQLGHIVAEPGERDSYNVVGAVVSEPGCGIGTRLYEALARYAVADGRVLASDTSLSTYSYGFWEKQVRKGRARWDDDEQRFRLEPGAQNDLSGRRSR